MKRTLLAIITLLTVLPLWADIVPLSFSGSTCDLEFQYDASTGVYTLRTTGGDPFAYTRPLPRNLAEDECMLYFDYQSTSGIGEMKFYFGNTYSEARSRSYGSLKSTGSSKWKEAAIDLTTAIRDFGWGLAGQTMRFDFGTSSGRNIKLKNIRISTSSPEDHEYYLRREQHCQRIDEYLSTTYPCSIDHVEVQTNRVAITGTVPEGGKYRLVELPLEADVTEDTAFVYQQDITEPHFTISPFRMYGRNGIRTDRLLSRWAIVDVSSGTPVLASHARYADEVKAITKPSEVRLRGKKGLGGFHINDVLSDLDDLSIRSVTVNVVLSALISVRSGAFANEEAYQYGNTTYYIDRGAISYYDRVFRECYQRGIVTSAILLVAPTAANDATTQLLRHPDYSGGYYTMPNMTTTASVDAYAAIITYLASRYNSSTNGRICHWIMHNEVDMGSEWTNMGDQPVQLYMDAYHKSMRLVYNIVRQYDQHAAVLGSYTHSWTANSDGPGYNTQNMLERTLQYSRAEGDFWWGVAYHPYPQNLTRPRFWVDDTQSTYDQDSPYCTFRNLEVLSGWALTHDHFYQGDTKRIVFLSENGTNSPDYSDTQLALQAAGACWAWKKTNALPGIDAIQWHNWIDNREEFGLRIGLRRYADDETSPLGPKPVWYVWQAADTDAEETVFAPYLSTLGVESWDDIFMPGLTPVVSPDARVDAPSQVYTIDGRYVGTTLQFLPAGLYVHRQDGRARKVWVR